jgi:hypothetical protein
MMIRQLNLQQLGALFMKTTLALFYILSLLLVGCSTQTYTLNSGASSTPDHQIMQPFFVEGIGQTKTIDAAKVCGGAEKVGKVSSKIRFIDGFLGAITFGIYTPRTAMVYCIK